jgi:hypothetical protein
MYKSLFLCADYANLTGDGKLNIMGVFSTVYAAQFPARHPSMHVIASLIGELGEEGQTRDVRILLLGPDGQRILDVGREMQVPQRGSAQKPEINAIYRLQGVVFPVPGPYNFILMVDKDTKGELPISLEQRDIQAQLEK